jgi:Holliday junction resolvase RusA-like endonuclease
MSDCTVITVVGAPPSSQQKGHGAGRVWQSPLHAAYMAVAKPQVRRQWPYKRLPKDEAIELSLTVHYPIPKSWPKGRRLEADGTYRLATPDADNLAKTVCDTLAGIVLEDDVSVQWGHIRRYWSSSVTEATSTITIRKAP